jgi:hypothetical protein
LNEMLHSLRLQLLTREDLTEAAHRIATTPGPITLKNEALAYRELLRFFETQRLGMIETLEEEEKLRTEYAKDSCTGHVLAIRNSYRELVPKLMNELLSMWRGILESGVVPVPKNSPEAAQRDQMRFDRVRELIRAGQL